MAQWACSRLAPGCHVVSDGTPAFAQMRQAGAVHERHVTGPGRQGVQTPQLHWVNTVLGNLKTSMAGTYHSFKHAQIRSALSGRVLLPLQPAFSPALDAAQDAWGVGHYGADAIEGAALV